MDSKIAKNKASLPLRRSTRQTVKVLSVEPTPRGPIKRTRKTSGHELSSALKGVKSAENGLDDEESPSKKYRLDNGEGDDENLNEDDMEVQESVKERQNDEDLEMDTHKDEKKETSRPKIYTDKQKFGEVHFSPRVILHKQSQIYVPPYEESQGMNSKKEIKAPASPTKARSDITPPVKKPDLPITSIDEYKRKMEAKARSAASSPVDVRRANQVLRSAYPASGKMYQRPIVNNIPAKKEADRVNKQDATKKSTGTKISTGKPRRGFIWYFWHLVFLVLLCSATLLGYRYLPLLQSKSAAGGGGQPPREVTPEKFSDHLLLLKSQFPNQKTEFWQRTKILLAKHLKTPEPTEPASLILVAGHKAESTLQCLAKGLASAYSSALNGSVLFIDGASKANQDSDKVKLDVDNQLQAAFEGDKPAVVIHRFEELPPGSTLIFYRYCDHESAAYKQVFLLFTALLPEEEISSELSLREVEELGQNYIQAKLVDSTGKADFNEMDINKFGGLWSRISHLVLPVVSEEVVQQKGCP